jgi:hypothetical protein
MLTIKLAGNLQSLPFSATTLLKAIIPPFIFCYNMVGVWLLLKNQ